MADNPYAQFVQAPQPQGNPYAQFATTPDDDVITAAMQHQASLPSAQRAASMAALPQSVRDGITARIRADAQAASTPEARAQRFQQIQAQNVASMSPVQKFLAGAGKSFVDTGRGIGEAVGLESPQDVANARQNDAALMDSGWGMAGNITGQGAQLIGGAALGGIGGAALKALPAVADAVPVASSALGKLGTASAVGAGYGYLSPYASEGEHVANTAIGAVVPSAFMGVGKGAQMVGRGVKGVVQRFTNPGVVADSIVARKLADDPNAAQAIAHYTPSVPGERPTLAQVVQSPQAVQLERMARSNPVSGPEIVAQDNANNAARMALLKKHLGMDQAGSALGGEPIDAMQAADMTRKANFGNFADTHLTPTTPQQRFGSALNVLDAGGKPRMSASDFDVFQKARSIANAVKSGRMSPSDGIDAFNALSPSSKNLAAKLDSTTDELNKGMIDPTPLYNTLNDLAMSPNGTARRGAQQILSSLKGMMDRDGGDSLMLHAGSLDQLRGGMGRIIRDAAQTNKSDVPQATFLLDPVKQRMVDMIESVAPGYRQAVQNYAEQSVPVNTAQQFRKFLDADTTRSLNSGGDRQATASQVAAFLNRANKSEFGISPQARADTKAVQQSLLDRSVADQKIGAAGSNTDADAQNRFAAAATRHAGATTGAITGSFVSPGFGTLGGMLLGHGADYLNTIANQRIAAALGERVMNPELARQAFVNRLGLLGRRQATNNLLLGVSPYVGIGAGALQRINAPVGVGQQ